MYTMKNINRAKNHYINRNRRIESLFLAALLMLASICSASGSGMPDIRRQEDRIRNAARRNNPAPASAKRLTQLAKTDQIELLEWSMALYDQNIRDYTAVLHKQERINGKLIEPQQIAFWFKEEPYSLLMKWEKNAVSIDKLLYVEGRADGNMYVHPTGPWSWIKSVKRKPRCKEALKGSLKTADEFGFYRNMLYLHEVLNKAQNSGSLKTSFLGQGNVHGRETIAVESVFTGKNCKYSKIIMHFGKESILPLALAFYDKNGKLISSYSFSDLKLNPGLKEEVFCKDNNKM